MRALIVNNDLKVPKMLEQAFSENEHTTIPWDGFKNITSSDYDFAVLSGSSNFPVFGNEDQLGQELELIRSGSIPILGICYGNELITVAFGGTLKQMPEKEQGVLHITVTTQDPIFEGIDDLFVYEGHRWTVDSLPDSLLPLAHSEHGIEATRHKEKLIYGLQFHPEKLQRETVGKKIIENFIALIP